MNRVTVQDAASMSPAVIDRYPLQRGGVRRAKRRRAAEALIRFGFDHDRTATNFTRRPSEKSVYMVSAGDTAIFGGFRSQFDTVSPHSAKKLMDTSMVSVTQWDLWHAEDASEPLGGRIGDGLTPSAFDSQVAHGAIEAVARGVTVFNAERCRNPFIQRRSPERSLRFRLRSRAVRHTARFGCPMLWPAPQ